MGLQETPVIPQTRIAVEVAGPLPISTDYAIKPRPTLLQDSHSSFVNTYVESTQKEGQAIADAAPVSHQVHSLSAHKSNASLYGDYSDL
jgi:hypothetical protein